MHVIVRKRLLEFAGKYPDSAQSLERWHRIVKHSNYNFLADLRLTFPQADQVGKFIIFNIGGNKYRLITYIMFEAKRIYIREYLTHADYDEVSWKAR